MGIENVKLGVCRVRYDGQDLGVTKGGVSVEVSTDTHKVTVDQFGESEINEVVMKRSVMVSAPLAETTVENLARVMPGATIVETGGTAATGEIAFAPNPVDGTTFSLGGVTFTFVTAASALHEITIGATLPDSLTAAVAVIAASVAPKVQEVTVTSDGVDGLVVTYNLKSVSGNSYVLGASTGGTVTAMSGGVDSKKRVEATNAIGTDLLAISKMLTLHPAERADDDVTEDFHVFKAATAGAVQFAYKLNEERIYNIEFTGYPDQSNGNKLFAVGDLSA